MILILIGVMYFVREFSFIKSSLTAAGVLTVFYLIISIYLFFKLNRKIDDIEEIIKSSIDYFFICIAAGVLIAQIKEIVRYVSFKFNIETIYHFFLLFIGISSTLLAIGLLTGQGLVALLLPGLIWAFLCSNDETYEEYDYNLKRLGIVLILLLVSIIVCLIICYVFHICNYYLYILITAFTLSCFSMFSDSHSFSLYIGNMIKAFAVLFMAELISIIGTIKAVLSVDSSMGKQYAERALEAGWNLVKVNCYLIVWLLILCLVIAIMLFIVDRIFSRLVNIINNRLIKIFVYMIILTVFVSAFFISLPYIIDFTTDIIRSMVGIEGEFSLF